MNRYRVCGLRLDSGIPFPELSPLCLGGDAMAADIELASGPSGYSGEDGVVVMSTELPDGTPWLICRRTESGYRFNFPEFAEFRTDSTGRRVTCAAPAETPAETLRHLFLDQVMPLLLNLRGSESLHASAVRAGGGVCAFIGRSGQGKSTLAAAFHKSGNAAYCDDCLLVEEVAGRVRVDRAYSGLRLWEDSRGALFGDKAGELRVSHYSDKVRISMPEGGDSDAARPALRAVYALQLDDEDGPVHAPLIEPLSMRDGLMILIEYAFRLDLSDRAMILRQLEVLERVVRSVPVKRLRLPRDLGALPAVRDMVLRDLNHG